MDLEKNLKSIYEYFVLYEGLLLFALICLAWSLPVSLLRHLLPQRIAVRAGQYAIMLWFRTYLFPRAGEILQTGRRRRVALQLPARQPAIYGDALIRGLIIRLPLLMWRKWF